ncbi:MAG: site-specific tyrosine recombinase XerC [Undibacterium sp.]|nr:site-specific tyrosine recombinase XerC [Undibacterium sp.]
MAHRTDNKAKAPIGDIRDPNSLYHYLRHFMQWRLERRFSQQTVTRDEECLRYFITWCDERGLQRPHDITKPILERYQRHLFLYRKSDGQPLSPGTQYNRLTPIRAYFKWLTKQNHILYNPASDLDMPRLDQRLPKHILSVTEVETILALPDVGTSLGIRDRAMMETLYSTGMRRLELIQLGVFNIDHERGTVMIRGGKGGKDRLIPIGERALQWIAKYRDDVRPDMVSGANDDTLFLTHSGEIFTAGRLSSLVRDYIDQSKIGKRGSCHLFRHSMATMMLENGADIRFIQAMLGHSSLTTTQIYTHVSIKKLKDIHSATHPARVIEDKAEQSVPTAEQAGVALLDLLAQEAQSDIDDD